MKTMRQQFVDTMLEVGKADDNLVVIVGDISHFSLQPFAKECPGRYYNIGICEPATIGVAAGLAKTGFHPVVHTIAPFIIERAFEQIKLDFCYQKLGGNLVTLGAVFDYSNLGCTHHCYGDFALLKTLPGAEIIYPASPIEFDVLFKQTYKNDKLTLFRIPGKQHEQEFAIKDIEVGKGIKVADGAGFTLVVTGPHLTNALVARQQLQGKGIDVEIIYVHTIRPLDTDLVHASLSKTRRVLVIEEHMRSGGLGDEILRIAINIPGMTFDSLAIPDMFVTGYGSYEEHCSLMGLTADGIVDKVLVRMAKE